MEDRIIKRVKYEKRQPTVTVEWSEGDSLKSLSCHESPAPVFVTAMRKLKNLVMSICDQAKGWEGNLEVIGVTFHWKGDDMLATISAMKPVTATETPWNIHTPNFPFEGKDLELLNNMIDRANEYIDGARADAKLPLGDNANEKNGD